MRCGVLFQRESHSLVECQAHHASRSLSRQRALRPLGLARGQRGSEKQAKKRYVKDNVRALGIFLTLYPASPFGLIGDFFDGSLIQASLRHQASTLMVDFFQQRLPGRVYEADAAKIDIELFVRGSGAQLAPALPQRGDGVSSQAPFNGEQDLAALFLCSDSKHNPDSTLWL